MNLVTSPIRIVATLLALASAVACSKKEDTPTPTTPAPTAGWKANGNNVAATFRANAGATVIAVIGEAGTGTTATRVTLVVPKATGTYSTGNTATIDYYVGTTHYVARPSAGSIVVSSYSATNIAGAFNFKAYNVVTSDTTAQVLSGGTFNVTY